MSSSPNKPSRSGKKTISMDDKTLLPDINAKVDELFIRWFNLPGKQQFLKEELKKIKKSCKERSNNTCNNEVNDLTAKNINKKKKHKMVVDKPLLSPRRSPRKRRVSFELNISEKSTSEKRVSTSKETSETIPRFYYPRGKPNPENAITETLSKISKAFKEIGKERLTRREMDSITDACGLTSYWKAALFKASCSSQDISTVTQDEVVTMWKRISKCNHDNPSKFVAMLAKPGNSYLDFDDFFCLMQDIVECHPGLLFLREAPEFHTRYINTVVARIFYMVNRSWSGQITVPELRKSNFLQVLDLLSEENDINAITDYFSYEHFYVVYCKFWELDTDHDLIVNKSDLARHGSGVLPIRLIERLLCGAVTRWDTSDHQHGQMSYVDFVWFLISEEDKTTSTSIEYWFRCMDLDGDGFISMYEMEYFYEEQVKKLEHLEIEALPFEDCVCQMLDMVKPALNDRITLRDLKQCKLAKIFFDTFFNIGKYLEHEQKDPFAPPKDGDYTEVSDWVRFATEEYELLVAEEHANEHQSGIDLSCSDETDALIKEEFANYGLSSDRGHTDDDLLYPQNMEDSKEVLSD